MLNELSYKTAAVKMLKERVIQNRDESTLSTVIWLALNDIT